MLMAVYFEIGDIHIQVSAIEKEVTVRHEDFEELAANTSFCTAWQSHEVEETSLENQIIKVVSTYKAHNDMEEEDAVYVGVWFRTPPSEPLEIDWTPIFKPELEILQGGKK